MTELTQDQVRHIAKLARLRLSEEEVQKFSKELSSILGYVKILSEIDTRHVAPTAQVTGISNRLRDDTIRKDQPSGEELLATSPLPIIENQIQTPSAHG